MTDGARVVAGVLCVVVLVGTGVPAAGQPTPRGVGGVSVSGSGVVTGTETGNGSVYVWQDEPIDVSATFRDYPEFRNYRVCLGYERADAPPRKLADECGSKVLSDGANGTVEFTNVTWPANVTGEQNLVAEVQGLSNQYNATLLDRKTISVTVLTRSGDADADGLSNRREAVEGYNLSNADMDGDGLNDGPEVKRYGTGPQDADTDGDGVRDGEEIEIGTNASAADTDGDWLSDGTELNLLRTDPTSQWTPVWLVGLVVLVGGVVVLGGTRFRRWWHDRGGAVAAGNGGSPDPDGGDDAAADELEPTPDPVPEPLTDEDRVERLLREHGGRMKQSRIVEETEWSKAKVSRLLSAMSDDGTVEKLSIGRENIVSLDGHGPEAARSPHEENASD